MPLILSKENFEAEIHPYALKVSNINKQTNKNKKIIYDI